MAKRRNARKSSALAEVERDPLIAYFKRTLPPEKYQGLQRLFLTPSPCLLCGTFPADVVGIFTTPRAELWGGQRGKHRAIGYHLCASCATLPDRAMRAEAQLARMYIGARN